MTTRTEQKNRIWNQGMSIKDKIAFAFDSKYLCFFFRQDGRLDEGLGIVLCYVLITVVYLFLTQAVEILLPLWFLFAMLFFRVHWKSVILKALSWIPKSK